MKKFMFLLVLWGILIIFNDGTKLFIPEATHFMQHKEGIFSAKHYYTIYSWRKAKLKKVMSIPSDKVKYIRYLDNDENLFMHR